MFVWEQEYEQYLDQLEREGNLQSAVPAGYQLMRPTPGFCVKCLITGDSGGRCVGASRPEAGTAASLHAACMHVY